MKYKYLQSYHLTAISDYCKKKCIYIVINHHNDKSEELDYYRGLYSGYIHVKKLCKILKLQRVSLTNKEFYEHLKHKKVDNENYRGVVTAFYDIRSFVTTL